MRFIVQGTVKPPEQASERITPDQWSPCGAPVMRGVRNIAAVAAAGLAFVTVPAAAETPIEVPSAEVSAVFASPHFIVKGTCEPIHVQAAQAETVTLDKWWSGSLQRFLQTTRQRSESYESLSVAIAGAPIEGVGGEVSAVFSAGHFIVAGTVQAISQQAGVVETVTLDKWKAADLRIPKAGKLYPHGEECPVFTEYLPSDAILDASRLVRRLEGQRPRSVPYPGPVAVAEDVTLDKWGLDFARVARPQLQKRSIPEFPLSGYLPSDAFIPSEAVRLSRRTLFRPADVPLVETHFLTLDKWTTGPSAEIRRRPPQVRSRYDLTLASFAEAVSLDRWQGPSTEIRREKLRGRTFYDFEKGGPTAEVVTFDKWEDRAALRPRSKRLFFYPPSELIQSAFAELVSLDRCEGASNAQRSQKSIRRAESSQPLVVAEGITLDKWAQQIARRIIAATRQKGESAYAPLIPEVINLDKWESRHGILVPSRRLVKGSSVLDLAERTELVRLDRFEGSSSRQARPPVQPVRSWITSSTVTPGSIPDISFGPTHIRLIRELPRIPRDWTAIDSAALLRAETILVQWLPSHTHVPRGPKQPTRSWTTEDTRLFISPERPFAAMFFLDGEGRVTAIIDGSGRVTAFVDDEGRITPFMDND